jgi:hypothetical protein
MRSLPPQRARGSAVFAVFAAENGGGGSSSSGGQPANSAATADSAGSGSAAAVSGTDKTTVCYFGAGKTARFALLAQSLLRRQQDRLPQIRTRWWLRLVCQHGDQEGVRVQSSQSADARAARSRARRSVELRTRRPERPRADPQTGVFARGLEPGFDACGARLGHRAPTYGPTNVDAWYKTVKKGRQGPAIPDRVIPGMERLSDCTIRVSSVKDV